MVDDQRPAPDATEPMPAATEPMPRATEPTPAATEPTPQAEPGESATPAATKEMPAVEGEDEAEQAPARWAGSAAVPEPGVRPLGGSTDEYDLGAVSGDDEGRSWWTPVLLGLAGVVLFGILMAGLWLIFIAGDNGSPGQTATSAPPLPSSAPPSSQPRSSAPPSSQPPTTAAAAAVPPVLGLSEAEARQRLTDAGLRVEVSRRTDPSAPPGTVIDVDPGQGAAVAPNSVVHIVVARALLPSAPTPSISAGG
jgi:hypothetical protein